MRGGRAVDPAASTTDVSATMLPLGPKVRLRPASDVDRSRDLDRAGPHTHCTEKLATGPDANKSQRRESNP
jgi:hypothetical protein